jgi:5-aminolevulinate synthase
MGPALTARSNQIVAGYASVAGNIDVQKMHQEKGLYTDGASVEQCPHASAARAAARMAEDLAAAAKKKAKADTAKSAKQAASASPAPSGCPYHQAQTKASATGPDKHAKATAPAGFNYEEFFVKELDRKHEDKSYRYFNNINRLAAKFPVAHTSDVKDEVEVWCANDYLGMGNNPVVLETIQCAYPFYHLSILCSGFLQSHFR